MKSARNGSRRRRRGGGRLAGGLAGVAAGAGLMYFLDPRRGAARRAQVTQRAGRAAREVERGVEAGARDLEHRARGLAHEVKARVSRERPPDEVVAERVRAKLGRLAARPGAIEVGVLGGTVELSGPVFAAEHVRVIRGVRTVRGVICVEDRLEPHETAEGVHALQGAGPSAGPRPEPLQHRWAPGTKLIAAAVGSALVGRALFGGLLGILAGVAGAALLAQMLARSGAARGDARRAAKAARDLVRGEHGGAEVQEVKSPAELEQGGGGAGGTPKNG